jgi:hypothetical protein
MSLFEVIILSGTSIYLLGKLLPVVLLAIGSWYTVKYVTTSDQE